MAAINTKSAGRMLGKAVHLVSLGCPKNLVDAEVMLARLQQEGCVVTDTPEKAHLILVNTCGFIQSAVEEAIDEILLLSKWKEKDPGKVLVVTGCMVQRYGAALQQELPEVDLFVGTDGFHRIDRLLAEKDITTNHTVIHRDDPLFLMDSSTPRVVSTPGHRAYLKISEGCDNRCSYCLIPSLRGRLRSREIADLVREAQALEEKGVKELTLVGQDLTAYGTDLYGKSDLTGLLTTLVAETSVPWIRMLYLYPARVDKGFLDCVAGLPRVLPYFDLPLQHVADHLLKRMGRPGREKDISQLLTDIRAAIPHAAIRGTFIVGFPGEQPEDVDLLASFLTRHELDHVGVFAYENEEESRSSRFSGQVAEEERRARRERIMALQAEIAAKTLRRRIGQRVAVLVEGEHPETDLLLDGRAWFQAPEIDGRVHITAGRAKPGEMVTLTVTDSHVYDLVGEITTGSVA